MLTASIVQAAATSPVFNIAGITNLESEIAGGLIVGVGAFAMFRAFGQQGHRHVMSMVAVVLIGLVFLGLGLSHSTNHLSTELSSLIFH